MLSRRELITTGVAGSLASSSAHTAPDAAAAGIQQQADREGQKLIADRIRDVDGTLERAFFTSSLAHGFVGKIREYMQQFLRANQKFPDYFEVGADVFMDLYDWHVKNRQQLIVTRGADNRYQMQFMFSTVILRPEQDPRYIGYPYDKG
jgi:hypothetical protein